jgi:hypothetical protein
LDFYWAFSGVWALDHYLAASIVSQRAEGPRFPSETGATYTLPITGWGIHTLAINYPAVMLSVQIFLLNGDNFLIDA